MSASASENLKRELLIEVIVQTTKGSDELKKTLNSFSTKQLDDLKGNVDLIAKDLDKPGEALLSTLKAILAKEPLETLSEQSMEDLFKKYLPDEHIPAGMSPPPM